MARLDKDHADRFKNRHDFDPSNTPPGLLPVEPVPFGFLYEVSAKVETLALDGNTMFVFHGKLGMIGSDTEPMAMALNVPEELWRVTNTGDTLQFDFRQVYSREP